MISGSATTRRTRGAPPAWIRWVHPGRHRVPVRWERCVSLAGGAPCSGPAPVHPAISVSGRRGAPACPRLFWDAVVHGPSQWSGPVGPAERPGLAGQLAGRVPRGAWRWMPSRFRQGRGTDSKGTGEPVRPVAGLGSILPSRGAGRPAGGGSGWSGGELGAPAPGWAKPLTERLRMLRTGSTWSVH